MYRRVKKQTFSPMVDTEERRGTSGCSPRPSCCGRGTSRKIMWHWKQLRGETRVLQKQLRDHFMLLEEPTHNTRQNVLRRVADNFYRQKILVISWVCINDDFTRARKAEMLVPAAQEHRDHLFERVVYHRRHCALRDGKRVKNGSRRCAWWLRFNGMRYAFEERERRAFPQAQTDAVAYNLAYGQKMAVCDRFIVNGTTRCITSAWIGAVRVVVPVQDGVLLEGDAQEPGAHQGPAQAGGWPCTLPRRTRGASNGWMRRREEHRRPPTTTTCSGGARSA